MCVPISLSAGTTRWFPHSPPLRTRRLKGRRVKPLISAPRALRLRSRAVLPLLRSSFLQRCPIPRSLGPGARRCSAHPQAPSRCPPFSRPPCSTAPQPIPPTGGARPPSPGMGQPPPPRCEDIGDFMAESKVGPAAKKSPSCRWTTSNRMSSTLPPRGRCLPRAC